MTQKSLLEKWHQIVFNKELEALHGVLADDVEFRSPFVWKPYRGRQPAFIILSTVIEVFTDFTYHRELIPGPTWALEFSAQVDKLSIKGIDLIQWNEHQEIAAFEVFVRPFNGLQLLGNEMTRRLKEKGLI